MTRRHTRLKVAAAKSLFILHFHFSLVWRRPSRCAAASFHPAGHGDQRDTKLSRNVTKTCGEKCASVFEDCQNPLKLRAFCLKLRGFWSCCVFVIFREDFVSRRVAETRRCAAERSSEGRLPKATAKPPARVRVKRCASGRRRTSRQ